MQYGFAGIAVAGLLATFLVGGAAVALANVADTPPDDDRADGIVGAWIGQAAIPEQDPYDVRLTFVSPKGGVSRYPGDSACGGVLTGDRDGDHYEYQEAITFGGREEVDNGCLDGKFKLTVDGDTMKVDWTSTNADGDQITTSGELHRQGAARKP